MTEDEKRSQKIHSEGVIACSEGLSLSDNPYAGGTADYRTWAFGFMSGEDPDLEDKDE